MTDDELNALVNRAEKLLSSAKHMNDVDGVEVVSPGIVPDLLTAITALRAQLAEAQAERAFTVSDGQRLLRKQDIFTVCDAPDLCFEFDDGVARCGPCAAKLAERAGITLNQCTVGNPEAMRLRRKLDRAEAALAAQIEKSE